MFLRKRCRRYVLLHSYRDGQGRVRQRRLGHFDNRAELEMQLQPERWRRWQSTMAQDYPEVSVDWERLQRKVHQLLATPEEADRPPRKRPRKATRVERIHRLIRTLNNLLDQETEPEVLEQVAPELQQILTKAAMSDDELGPLRQRFRQAKATLPPRRRTFDPADPQIIPYLDALETLLQALDEKEQWEDCALMLCEQVQKCPSTRSHADYGAILQLLGHFDQAIECYHRIPHREAVRHYNLASCAFQMGRTEEALEHLLRGFNRDRSVADTLLLIEKGRQIDSDYYWRHYGRLWSPKAKSFLRQVYRQFPVQRRLRQVGERGIQARNLLTARARGYVLSKLDEPPVGLKFEP